MQSTAAKKNHLVTSLLTLTIATAVPAAVGCSGEPGDPYENIDEVGMSFEEFEATVFQEPDTGIYIVDGDTPILTRAELEVFYVNFVRDGALIVHQANGGDAKWNNTEKLNLTYCVSTTFGNHYDAVVQAMASAAGAWEAAANIHYVHNAAQDGSCSANNKKVVFDVRPVDVGGQYLARSFFPNQGRNSRNVLIDNTAFTTSGQLTLTGILRHELGHTLGFRHEHTRPESGACFEDNHWRALTPYDSDSVMHYPQCNGTNTWALTLTSDDKAGAAILYGTP